MLEIDKEILARLHAIGFKLDIGPEGGGHQMHVRKNHGGYYLNVGCSDLLAKGEIGLLHYEDIERFVADGALMKDGRVEKADLVVCATGYHAPTEVIEQLLGEEIAEKIGPVWGMDQGGEMCNMYKPTPQKRPLVHRRRVRAGPRVVPLPRLADQGPRGGHHRRRTARRTSATRHDDRPAA